MNTKDRMVGAAIDALGRRGPSEMSFTEVLAASGAARGAIYHHFPAGKAELIETAVRRNGADVAGAFAGLPAAASIGEVVDTFLTAIRAAAEGAAAGCSCAIGGVTSQLEVGSGLQHAAGEAFDAWRVALEAQLRAAGAGADRATDLAALLIAVLEGTHVLCRAAGSPEPFDRLAAELRRTHPV